MPKVLSQYSPSWVLPRTEESPLIPALCIYVATVGQFKPATCAPAFELQCVLSPKRHTQDSQPLRAQELRGGRPRWPGLSQIPAAGTCRSSNAPTHIASSSCQRERTLAWISRSRRLGRDFERYAPTFAGFVRLAMIRSMPKRPTKPTLCSWIHSFLDRL